MYLKNTTDQRTSRSDHIEAVPLCHIPVVHIGFDVCEVQYELDEEAELIIQWLIECLEIQVDDHALECLDVRCTVNIAPKHCYGLESEMLDDLNTMLQQERFSVLKQFSVTTAWEDYEDKPRSVSNLQRLHDGIVEMMKVMENRCLSKTVAHDRHDKVGTRFCLYCRILILNFKTGLVSCVASGPHQAMVCEDEDEPRRPSAREQ